MPRVRILHLTMLLTMPWMMAENTQANEVDAFESHTFHSAAGALHYRLLKPTKLDPSTSYPLVLFLHGAGERGGDNRSQLRHVVGVFAEEANRTNYPCFVVAPQCPANHLWCNTPWNVDKVVQPPGESAAMQEPDLLPWLFFAVASYPLDAGWCRCQPDSRFVAESPLPGSRRS